jgi:hypothetical protein
MLCSVTANGDSMPSSSAGARNSSPADTSGPASIDRAPLNDGSSRRPAP